MSIYDFEKGRSVWKNYTLNLEIDYTQLIDDAPYFHNATATNYLFILTQQNLFIFHASWPNAFKFSEIKGLIDDIG